MIISFDEKKTFDKIKYLFMIKTLRKVGVERNFFNLMKLILYLMNWFILKIRKKAKKYVLLFNILVEVIAIIIKQKKKRK